MWTFPPRFAISESSHSNMSKSSYLVSTSTSQKGSPTPQTLGIGPQTLKNFRLALVGIRGGEAVGRRRWGLGGVGGSVEYEDLRAEVRVDVVGAEHRDDAPACELADAVQALFSHGVLEFVADLEHLVGASLLTSDCSPLVRVCSSITSTTLSRIVVRTSSV